MGYKFNSLIIGAGNIGAFFDTPECNDILTHAHAFYKNESFNLLGFVDINLSKSNEAAGIWNCKSFNSIEDAFNFSNIEVVSITAPDECHYEILKTITKYPVKLIWAEKPLAKTLKEADELLELYQNKNLPVLVNYSRRFVKEFWEIREKILNGHYGEYLTGTGYYGKGILHNGSHMIDLIRFLIGEIQDFEVIDSVKDYYNDDPSVSVILKFDNQKAFSLNAVNCKYFTIFESDFIFEKARIKMINSGFVIEEYQVKDSEIYKGYKNLNLINTINTSLNFSMYNAVNNIYEFLTGSNALICDINDGYKAMELSLKILEKA